MPLSVRDLRERARATRRAVATPANMRFIVRGGDGGGDGVRGGEGGGEEEEEEEGKKEELCGSRQP